MTSYTTPELLELEEKNAEDALERVILRIAKTNQQNYNYVYGTELPLQLFIDAARSYLVMYLNNEEN